MMHVPIKDHNLLGEALIEHDPRSTLFRDSVALAYTRLLHPQALPPHILEPGSMAMEEIVDLLAEHWRIEPYVLAPQTDLLHEYLIAFEKGELEIPEGDERDHAQVWSRVEGAQAAGARRGRHATLPSQLRSSLPRRATSAPSSSMATL